MKTVLIVVAESDKGIFEIESALEVVRKSFEELGLEIKQSSIQYNH